jgi:hypothetical protein
MLSVSALLPKCSSNIFHKLYCTPLRHTLFRNKYESYSYTMRTFYMFAKKQIKLAPNNLLQSTHIQRWPKITNIVQTAHPEDKVPIHSCHKQQQ